MVSETPAVIEVLGVPPALDAQVQRFRAVHLLDAKAIVAEGVEHLPAHAAVAGQALHLVVGVQQAAGHEYDLLAPCIVSSVSHK